MRVLWLCNIVLPDLCEEFGFKKTVTGGWITGMWDEVRLQSDISLGICVPIIREDRMKDGEVNGCKYYSFQMDCDENIIDILTKRFFDILEDFRPDLIHIWGTEYLHSYAMVQACTKRGLINHVIVNIQGLISIVARHYVRGLPELVRLEKVDGKSINDEIEDFKKRGRYEIKLLQMINHVIGRTAWDKACTLRINKKLNYHYCGEILRGVFYNKDMKWDIDRCERYSVFVSQAGYAVKGLHLILKELKKLYESYSKLHVYIAGPNLWKIDSTYSNYIRKEIDKFELKEVIDFVGVLSEREMVNYYLSANVFLSSSVIENSSNSICEALHVGTPIVSSYVGGVTSLIEHERSGFLYPLDEEYMITYYVGRIFDDMELAKQISRYERKQAEKLNDKKEILNSLLHIYQEIEKEARYES